MKIYTFLSVVFLFIFNHAAYPQLKLKEWKPDLLIDKIYSEPPYPNLAENKPVNFKILVQNWGNYDSKPCKLLVRIGGETRGKIIDIKTLKPGHILVVKRACKVSATKNTVVFASVDPYGKVDELRENNNTKKFTYKPGKPDFIVEQILLSNPKPKVGEEVSITVKTKNIGKAYVSPFELSIRIGGESRARIYLVKHYYMKGGTQEIVRKFRSTSRMKYLITAKVDPYNKWKEVKEGNNTKKVKIRFR